MKINKQKLHYFYNHTLSFEMNEEKQHIWNTVHACSVRHGLIKIRLPENYTLFSGMKGKKENTVSYTFNRNTSNYAKNRRC